MFLNLLDIGLQEQIMDAKDFDFDVKNAISILLEDGQSSIKNDLEDWKLKKMTGRRFYSTKEKYMCLRTKTFDVIL